MARQADADMHADEMCDEGARPGALLEGTAAHALEHIHQILGRAQVERLSPGQAPWHEMFDELAQATVEFVLSTMPRRER